VTRRTFGPLQKKAMRVRVSGKQMEIGETPPAGARARLGTTVARHFDGGVGANAVFNHDGPLYRADCTPHLASKTIIRSEGEGADTHRAYGVALNRIELQLRRYKRKLKNHHAKACASSRVSA
jgi:ribosomal subunit interface protein